MDSHSEHSSDAEEVVQEEDDNHDQGSDDAVWRQVAMLETVEGDLADAQYAEAADQRRNVFEDMLQDAPPDVSAAAADAVPVAVEHQRADEEEGAHDEDAQEADSVSPGRNYAARGRAHGRDRGRGAWVGVGPEYPPYDTHVLRKVEFQEEAEFMDACYWSEVREPVLPQLRRQVHVQVYGSQLDPQRPAPISLAQILPHLISHRFLHLLYGQCRPSLASSVMYQHVAITLLCAKYHRSATALYALPAAQCPENPAAIMPLNKYLEIKRSMRPWRQIHQHTGDLEDDSRKLQELYNVMTKDAMFLRPNRVSSTAIDDDRLVVQSRRSNSENLMVMKLPHEAGIGMKVDVAADTFTGLIYGWYPRMRGANAVVSARQLIRTVWAQTAAPMSEWHAAGQLYLDREFNNFELLVDAASAGFHLTMTLTNHCARHPKNPFQRCSGSDCESKATDDGGAAHPFPVLAGRGGASFPRGPAGPMRYAETGCATEFFRSLEVKKDCVVSYVAIRETKGLATGDASSGVMIGWTSRPAMPLGKYVFRYHDRSLWVQPPAWLRQHLEGHERRLLTSAQGCDQFWFFLRATGITSSMIHEVKLFCKPGVELFPKDMLACLVHKHIMRRYSSPAMRLGLLMERAIFDMLPHFLAARQDLDRHGWSVSAADMHCSPGLVKVSTSYALSSVDAVSRGKRNGVPTLILWEAKTAVSLAAAGADAALAASDPRKVIEIEAADEASFAKWCPDAKHRDQLLHEAAVYAVHYVGYIRCEAARTSAITRVLFVHFTDEQLRNHLLYCQLLNPLLSWIRGPEVTLPQLPADFNWQHIGSEYNARLFYMKAAAILKLAETRPPTSPLPPVRWIKHCAAVDRNLSHGGADVVCFMVESVKSPPGKTNHTGFTISERAVNYMVHNAVRLHKILQVDETAMQGRNALVKWRRKINRQGSLHDHIDEVVRCLLVLGANAQLAQPLPSGAAGPGNAILHPIYRTPGPPYDEAQTGIRRNWFAEFQTPAGIAFRRNIPIDLERSTERKAVYRPMTTDGYPPHHIKTTGGKPQACILCCLSVPLTFIDSRGATVTVNDEIGRHTRTVCRSCNAPLCMKPPKAVGPGPAPKSCYELWHTTLELEKGPHRHPLANNVLEAIKAERIAKRKATHEAWLLGPQQPLKRKRVSLLPPAPEPPLANQ